MYKYGGGASLSHFSLRIQIGDSTYWRVSFGFVPNLQRGSPWLRRRPAQVDRLIRRAQNSSIRFRKCAVTGWRAQQPKSNSASNSRKNEAADSVPDAVAAYQEWLNEEMG